MHVYSINQKDAIVQISGKIYKPYNIQAFLSLEEARKAAEDLALENPGIEFCINRCEYVCSITKSKES